MKRVIIYIAYIVFFSSCGKTTDVIKIKKLDNNIPIEIGYNVNNNVFTGIKFHFRYNVENSSSLQRKSWSIGYIKENSFKTCKVFEDTGSGMIRISSDSQPYYKNNKPVSIVIESSFAKIDSMLKIENFNDIKYELREFHQDTIKVFRYKSFDELYVEMPELLEFYFKTDSIRFEFDDSELPFYVKRSYYKDTLDGQVFEGKLERPFITVPVLGK